MKQLLFLSIAMCTLHSSVFAAELPIDEGVAKKIITSTLYLKNCSECRMRLSVGPTYPKAIALCPGQVHEFPLKEAKKLHVSCYGKYSSYISDSLLAKVGNLDMEAVLKEHPEYYTQNCLINITYEKESPHAVWGKWVLDVKVPESKETQEEIDVDSQVVKLRKVIKYPSISEADPIAQKAAIVWSIFPRVAEKLIAGESVYPFNILGLDIGGTEPKPEQLTNWGQLLYSVSKKRFASISDQEVWNAVNMIIADAIEWMKIHRCYYTRSTEYPLTLLQIRTPAADAPQLPPADPTQRLIERLKEKVKDMPDAKMLVTELEWEMRIKSSQASNEDESSVTPPPPPPPPAPQMGIVKETLQEKAINKFLVKFRNTPPEAQKLRHTVAYELFERIDKAGNDHEKIVLLKKTALDRLKPLSKQSNGTRDLTQIRQFFSDAMAKLAYENSKPGDTLNGWITLIITASGDKAKEYSKMDEQELKKQIMPEKVTAQDPGARLMECLKLFMKRKFPHPQDSQEMDRLE